MSDLFFRDLFTSAINNLELIEVTYNSTSKGLVTQELVPLDIGPWRRQSSGELRYHFYSVSSDKPHPIALRPDQILQMNRMTKRFEPANIVHWVPDWHIVRDWGLYS
jgi:hypothetical protein